MFANDENFQQHVEKGPFQCKYFDYMRFWQIMAKLLHGFFWQKYYFRESFLKISVRQEQMHIKLLLSKIFPYFHHFFLRKPTELVIFQENGNVLKIFQRMTIFANSKVCKNGKRHFDFNPTTGSAETT